MKVSRVSTMAQEAPKKEEQNKIKQIEDILKQEFNPSHLEVINETHSV